MKIKILLLSILVFTASLSMQAQRVNKSRKSKSSTKNKEKGFKNDEDFNVTAFPDKWKDESAIILCQKYDFSYVKFSMNGIHFKEIFRKRIFINDKKAKDEFSVFYYVNRDAENNNIGFKVEKPDGRIIDVDLEDGVEVGANEVSSTYRSYYSYSKTYMKIAIPNLEIGDIIDYYVTGVRVYSGSQEIDFAAFSFSLSREYPILKQKFFFNIDKGFKVNYRSFNGAPEIHKTNKSGVNKYGKTKKDIKTYIIEDEDRDKLKNEIWKYNSLEEAWIKFQVYYAPGSMALKSQRYIKKEKDLINTPLSERFIIEKILKNENSNISLASAIVSYVKKQQKKLRTPEKIADLVYYYYRYIFWKNVFLYDDNSYSRGDLRSIDYIYFTNTFANVLTTLKVPYKYVIAVDRGTGGFDNVLFSDDVTSGIKVGENYYYYFSNFSTKDMLPYFIMGTDLIEFNVDRRKKVTNKEHANLPISDYNDNSLTSTIKVDFNESMDTLYIVNHDSLTGLIKSAYQLLILRKTDYLNDDKSIYDPAYIKEQARIKERNKRNANKKTRLSKSGKLKKDEKDRADAQKKEKLEKWRSDYVINFFDNDYVVAKVDDVKIISKGRMPKNTSLVVEEKFRVEELISKAGRNYIFKIGSLIGSQLELDEDDMTRESDIRLSYQKKYSYNIEVNIPEGYHVESVESLNYNVVNDIGEFTAVAKIVDNKIIIKTNKKYKKLFTPKEEWNNYIDFLEAAYEFSQKRIIIKKVRK